MKSLIALLFILSMSLSAFATSKVDQYFELGTSLDWNKSTSIAKDSSEKVQHNLTIQATKGYVFKKHWDFSLGLRYAKLAADQAKHGNGTKRYGARVGLKYVFSKRPSFIKHYHKTWMTPYVGVAYQWGRLSPHTIVVPISAEQTIELQAKTEVPSYIASVGVRCFMTKNLAITWDLSYSKGKTVTTNKASLMKLKNENFTEIKPSLSFVYFY